jgi:hypothetical protein
MKNYETVQKRAGERKHTSASAGKKESWRSKSYISERSTKFVKYFSYILPGIFGTKKL